MAFQKKAPQVRDNAARMVVYGQGDRMPDQKLDLSYLENVVETAPEGSSNLINPVEAKPDEPILGEVVQPTDQPPSGQAEADKQPTQPTDQQAASQPVGDDEVDDPKFKGKSKKELYNSFKELETRLGKQGNELGDYRKFFDQFMLKQASQQIQTPSTVQAPNVSNAGQGTASGDEDEGQLLELMLSKPKDFVKQIRQQARSDVMGELQNLGTTQIISQIDQKNADVLQDPNFEAWALSNTTLSMRQEADKNPQVRQFIFNSYRSMSGKSQTQPTHQQSAQVDSNGAAPQPTTNRTVSVSPSATGATANSTKPGPKIWTRSEVRELYANDRQAYQRQANEIKRAYDEGRVVNEK